MTHPTLIEKDAEIRYQQLLQEAEAERLYQRLKGNNSSLWQRAGDLLITVGQTLKAQAPSSSTTPSLDPK